MIRHFFAFFLMTGACWGLMAVSTSVVTAEDGFSSQIRGRWEVVDLVDDGRVIPKDAIHLWIPSGGRIEVIDNTFVFTSTFDGQRHAKTFEVDATRYPHELNVREEGKLTGYGICRLDQGQIVICAAPPDLAPRPTDFSATRGSRRVLMVLSRAPDSPAPATGAVPAANAAPAKVQQDFSQDLSKLPPPPDLRAPAGNTGKMLSDADVVRMLCGNWKYRDAYGDLFLTLNNNNTFNTFRETLATSAFQQVFVRAPISSGTWVLKNGQLTFQCTSSVARDRVNRSVPVMVRSISDNDLIFMDLNGQVGKAVKVR